MMDLDVVTWFTECQRRSVFRSGVVPEWFHGIISRNTTEELLASKPRGYFLIRISESRIGYSLSYRADDRCRHFMINVLEDGHYVIPGENRRHRSLQDLVDHHRRNPIMPFTELLTVACGQSSNDKTDYAELVFRPRRLTPEPGTLQTNPTQQNMSRPETPPPTLPSRPQDLWNSTGPPLSWKPTNLYPCLQQEFPHLTPQAPFRPLTASEPPCHLPPEVPARINVPPLLQDYTCVQTDCALQGAASPTATQAPLSRNSPAPKPSVSSNLKIFKKKFQKKKTTPEHLYAEINMGDANANAYEQIQVGAQPAQSGATSPDSNNYVIATFGTLPLEYLPPPPFAPGH